MDVLFGGGVLFERAFGGQEMPDFQLNLPSRRGQGRGNQSQSGQEMPNFQLNLPSRRGQGRGNQSQSGQEMPNFQLNLPMRRGQGREKPKRPLQYVQWSFEKSNL